MNSRDSATFFFFNCQRWDSVSTVKKRVLKIFILTHNMHQVLIQTMKLAQKEYIH